MSTSFGLIPMTRDWLENSVRLVRQEAGVHMKEGWAVLEVRPAKGSRLELHSRRQRTIAGGAPSSLLKWDQV